METHMDEPCDICGDVGYVEAICTCYVCKISRQHTYCMKTYCRDIPLFWRCEECEPSSENLASQSRMKEALPKAPKLNSSGPVHKNENFSGVTKPSTHLGQSRKYREKWADKGKTKHIDCQEAIQLSSGSTKFKPPLKNRKLSSPGPSRTFPTSRATTSISPKVISPKSTSHMVKAKPSVGILRQSRPPRPVTPVAQQPVMKSLTKLKENKVARHSRNDGAEIRQPVDEVKNPKEAEYGNTKTDMELGKEASIPTHGSLGPPLSIFGGKNGGSRSSNAEERNQKLTGSNACKNGSPGSSNAEESNQKRTVSEIEKCYQGVPARRAFWKGSFKLPDGLKHLELNNGFNAHPPSKVLLKIYDFLKNMPGSLDFELVPRFKVLTDVFEGYCPDKDDVGLYFFPCNDKSPENNTSLLEFMWTEKLVMRSYVNGVELFVLTSQALHQDFQKWNGNYYLWGVFRRVKMPNNHADNMVQNRN